MKLRVVCNTHKRPAQALAVIECLRALSSSKHEVSYVLAYDYEDTLTNEYVSDLLEAGRFAEDIDIDCRHKPASLQDCWNRNFTDPSLADFWLPMPDDGFCAAPNWDDLIVQTAAAAPVPELAVIGWHDMANPTMFTVPIVTRGWLEAIAPEPLMDPRFPFWFSDTAISETWSYVFGRTPPRPEYLLLAGKPGQPNPGLADADKWWDLYADTRWDRICTAQRVREKHGLPNLENMSSLVMQWCSRDVRGRQDTHRLIEHMKGEQK